VRALGVTRIPGAEQTRRLKTTVPSADDTLREYRDKRNPGRTPEPVGDPGKPGDPGEPHDSGNARRFVIQEHHATRLHWDLRLEHDGTLASWAIPNGIPPDREENRLAVRTEDHPLQYLDFHGEIPAGEYGAGTMTIWDAGTYELHTWSADKVEVSFRGERLQGRYGLFPIGRRRDGGGSDADWMIHRMDPPTDPAREPMPAKLAPMLAGAGTLPRDRDRDRDGDGEGEGDGTPGGWAFEVKWDGVRALAYLQPGRIRLESRNLNVITDAYPEVRGILADLGMREAVLDGEIVAFGEDGRPSFEALQKRMHVTSPSAVKRLRASTPVVYAIFDLLHLDGRSLMGLPYDERRAELAALALSGPAWRVPVAHTGNGRELLEATGAQGLEGIVAKRRDSRYEPGRRTGAWVKIKHVHRQELVIGGWLAGEGKRANRVGALLMGVHDADPAAPRPGALRYAGRVGTGFSERTLDELAERLATRVTDTMPFDPPPKLPRGAVYVRPELIAEVEFREWTAEGLMRAPSFKGLRDDKPAVEVVREPAHSPETLFDDVRRRADGALAVRVDGRSLKLSNWDKVLFPETGFTKGDLIAYYARIATVVIPHLRGRALTLKRYPGGVDSPYFYEKQSPAHRPEWVSTARIAGVDYTVCEDRATLVWLANLADIELHTSLALAAAPQRPTMIVFDLDPGPPASVVECCEVALVLRGLFDQLSLKSVAKVSGSKGMQMYVPLNCEVSYAQTKQLARQVAEALAQRMPELVVSRMSKQLRPGRVLVDWSQNDTHKTTVNVYSVRARERATVSAPVSWAEVESCRAAADPEMLSFSTDQVLARVDRDGDPFAMLLSTVQALPSV
jgi:bifunctional non-homologous end joining protein LigD